MPRAARQPRRQHVCACCRRRQRMRGGGAWSQSRQHRLMRQHRRVHVGACGRHQSRMRRIAVRVQGHRQTPSVPHRQPHPGRRPGCHRVHAGSRPGGRASPALAPPPPRGSLVGWERRTRASPRGVVGGCTRSRRPVGPPTSAEQTKRAHVAGGVVCRLGSGPSYKHRQEASRQEKKGGRRARPPSGRARR